MKKSYARLKNPFFTTKTESYLRYNFYDDECGLGVNVQDDVCTTQFSDDDIEYIKKTQHTDLSEFELIEVPEDELKQVYHFDINVSLDTIDFITKNKLKNIIKEAIEKYVYVEELEVN